LFQTSTSHRPSVLKLLSETTNSDYRAKTQQTHEPSLPGSGLQVSSTMCKHWKLWRWFISFHGKQHPKSR